MNDTLVFALLFGFLFIAAAYVIGIFNTLQTIKTRIVAAVQEIGNQLKRQASLIPNLQESVKAYLKHEKGIFDTLAAARKTVDVAVESGSMKDAEKASQAIQKMIPQIQAVFESNPQIQANQTVQQFMDELRDTADKLMYSRRVVIDLSQSFNEKLMTFPSNIIANMFGFKPEKGLETPMTGAHVSVSEEETKDVKVSF